ncbi:hypothetical protein C8Q78DRAFT_1082858 [Trametes maxima]|nr:hypothetical protein C8Q78DRAFT_1082858 [Trametes maxima]
MDKAALPVEVCENIIDLMASHEPLWTTPDEYEMFKICALVCHAWTPRSQFNLFYCLHLNKASQVDHLCSVFSNKPSLLANVRYVHIGDFLVHKEAGETFTKESYIPFASGRLMHALRNASVLRLTGLAWNTYPSTYTSFFRQLEGIRDLQLCSVTFSSVGDLVRIVWNCRALRSLSIEYPRMEKAPTDVQCARLIAARNTTTCQHLRRIDFEAWEDSDGTPPLRALSDNVSSLSLKFNSMSPWRPRGRVLDTIPQFVDLRELELSITFDGSMHGHVLTPSNPPGSEWTPQPPLIAFLSRIQAPQLESLTLKLRPTAVPPEIREGALEDENPDIMFTVSRTYQISRARMIETVIGKEVLGVLNSGQFGSLALLALEIEEHPSTAPALGWWTSRLMVVMPERWSRCWEIRRRKTAVDW